jgi:TonB-linked SusC/RagA family outer membrane protein
MVLKILKLARFQPALFAVLIIAPVLAQNQTAGRAFPDSKPITGKVSGISGNPLPGASITVIKKKQITLTDNDGLFAIEGLKGDKIEVSYIGFKSQIIVIPDTGFLQIVMQEVALALQDVVLLGYSTIRVKEITGSVAVLKQKDLMVVPAGQAEQMLQGRVAGLSVVTGGMPGGASTVSIHGVGNFGDVRPLYIIDGIQGDINILNPGDIESIQVLKDAGAYAVYGVRGANGVIIIETKKGKTGRPVISYDMYVGYQLPTKNSKILSPAETAELTWTALRNSNDVGPNGNPNHPLYGSGVTPELPYYLAAGPYQGLGENDPLADPSLYNLDFTNGDIYQIIRTNVSGTDWWGEIFAPAFSQNHSVNLSGGTDKTKYLLGLGFLNQNGTLRNSYLKRYSVRINTSYQIGSRVQVGENLQLSLRDNPKETEGLNQVFTASTAQTILPVYDIKGNLAASLPYFLSENAVAINQYSKNNQSKYSDLLGNIWIQLDLIKDLKIRSNFGGSLNYSYGNDFAYSGYLPSQNARPDNRFNETSGYGSSYTWTNTLHYTHHFQKQHLLNSFIGMEAINTYSRNMGGSAIGYFFNDPAYRFLGNGLPPSTPNFSVAKSSTLLSYIGKTDYSFKEKYFFSFSIRRDGSSLFGRENRFGWFPSVSGAWRITEEKFLQHSELFTDIKLRAGWGRTGYFGNTDPLNQYTLFGGNATNAYYDLFGVASGNIQQGFTKIRIGNPWTGWQQDEQFNIGIEALLWKGKFYFTTDWYKKTAKGLLFPVSLPDVIGGATPPNINVGEIRNYGFDLLVGSKGKIRQLTWDLNFILTSYNNRIVKLNDLSFFDVPESGYFVRNQTGKPANSFFGYKVIGFFKDEADVLKSPFQPDAKQGRFKYLDADNDGKITDNDRVFFGHANPGFTLGTNLNLLWKNFDLSAFFYGSFGNEIIAPRAQLTDFFPTFSGLGRIAAKSKTLLYESWTPDRLNAKTSIAENSINFSNVGVVNSYLMRDGSYFRSKSITLGYSLNRRMLERLKLTQFRFYVQAVNLFTITPYDGMDPEIGGSGAERYGVDYTHYPNNQRQFVLGLNIRY